MRTRSAFRVVLFIASLKLVAAPAVCTGPGAINHVDGFALLNGKPLPDGQAASEAIRDGSLLVTGAGFAEVLLDPGIFLRLGPNTAARFEIIGADRMKIQLERGEVLLDAASEPRGNVSIRMGALSVVPIRPGLYEIDACRTLVYAGAAEITEAAHRELTRASEQADCSARRQKFNRDRADALYSWSARVAEYEAAASYGVVLKVASNSPGSSWRWNDVMRCWGYVPSAGVVPDPLGWSFAASARDLKNGLILNGSRSGYPALVDPHNHPRILSMPAMGATVSLARARRIKTPDVVVPVSSGPGNSAPPFSSGPY